MVALGGVNDSVEIAFIMDDTVPSAVYTDPIRLRQVCDTVVRVVCGTDARSAVFFVQVIGNVVANAVKFSTDGGCVTVRVCATRLERESDSQPFLIRFEVVDTGVGIAFEQLPMLFRAFGQLDSRCAFEVYLIRF
jgi:signal transduction histidine kinase